MRWQLAATAAATAIVLVTPADAAMAAWSDTACQDLAEDDGGVALLQKQVSQGSIGREAPSVDPAKAEQSAPDEIQRRDKVIGKGVEQTIVGEIFAAFFSKLSCSSVDVVWLLPYLLNTPKGRILTSFVYIVCMELVVLIAWLACWVPEMMLKAVLSSRDWTGILCIMAPILLALVACKLFWEWLHEQSQGDPRPTDHDFEPETEPTESERAPASDDCVKPPADADCIQSKDKVGVDSTLVAKTFSLRSLILVCLLSSADDFALFTDLLASGDISAPVLFLGVFMASAVIMLLCVAVTFITPLARMLSRIPVWLVFGALAAITFYQGVAFLQSRGHHSGPHHALVEFNQ